MIKHYKATNKFHVLSLTWSLQVLRIQVTYCMIRLPISVPIFIDIFSSQSCRFFHEISSGYRRH